MALVSLIPVFCEGDTHSHTTTKTKVVMEERDHLEQAASKPGQVSKQKRRNYDANLKIMVANAAETSNNCQAARRRGALGKKRNMLVLDAFRGHLTEPVKKQVKAMNGDLVIIPGG